MRRTISTHEQIRRARGFTVTGLARETGYSHTYVSLVEGGQCRPSARYRQAVTDVLRVPEELIFGTVAATDQAEQPAAIPVAAESIPDA